jgi:S-adenosylmethionine hydrolase
LVKDPVRLDAWRVRRRGAALLAAVVHIDHFGNCITALPASRLTEIGKRRFRAELPGGEKLAVRKAYVDAAPGEGLALAGSSGLLEIAVREGYAAAAFNLARGSVIRFAARL